MMDRFSRTKLVYGAEAMEKLASSHVAVFGIGGVGGYVVEALARSGIGALDLIDDDKVCLTNINRQIIATEKTIGRYKVDVAKERVHDINPDCVVRTYKTFFLPNTQDLFDFTEYDYVVVISSMGAGNKTDPSMFEVADLYRTSICPLAKVMRRECRKRGIDSLKVVYSREEPRRPLDDMQEEDGQNCGSLPETDGKHTGRRAVPGSTAFVPSVAGLIAAGEVINDLIGR